MSDGAWEALAREILRDHKVAVVATSRADVPWASTVYYAEDGFTLYVNTPSSTRMLGNMKGNPAVAYVVDDRTPDLFLQGEGTARVVAPGPAWDRAAALIRDKVPGAHVGQPGFEIVAILTRTLHLSDFRDGYRPRVTIDAGGTSADGA